METAEKGLDLTQELCGQQNAEPANRPVPPKARSCHKQSLTKAREFFVDTFGKPRLSAAE